MLFPHPCINSLTGPVNQLSSSLYISRGLYWLPLEVSPQLVLCFFILICSLTQLSKSFSICQIWCQRLGARRALLGLICPQNVPPLKMESSCDPHIQHTILNLPIHWPQGWRLFQRQNTEKTGNPPVWTTAGWLIYRELSEELKSAVKIFPVRKGNPLCMQPVSWNSLTFHFCFKVILLSLKESGWLLWEPKNIYYAVPITFI